MGQTEFLITVILFNLFFVGFIISIWIYIKKYRDRKKEYLNDLKITNEIHQKELLATQLEIQQATMQEIGRELHDNIGQKLTLVSLYSQQLIFENKAPQINDKIEQVTQIINESIMDLRSLSQLLADDKINDKTSVELIQEEVDRANLVKKASISFENTSSNHDLNFREKNVLLRIVQESIQNSLKYSDCSEIKIQLSNPKENELLLKISDNGKGFEIHNHQSEGIGLKNMKKRVEILNGKFSIESSSNAGTHITTQLKLRP